MYDKKFWESAAERAIKTFAQVFVAFVGSDVVGIYDIDFSTGFSTALGAALLSVLTSVASARMGKNPGPSLTAESTHPETVILEVEVPVEKTKPVAKKKPPVKKAASPKKK
jgi:hypothetical protein